MLPLIHAVARTNRTYEDQEVNQAVRLSSVGARLSSAGMRANKIVEDQEVCQAVLIGVKAVISRCEAVLRGYEDDQEQN